MLFVEGEHDDVDHHDDDDVDRHDADDLEQSDFRGKRTQTKTCLQRLTK